MEPIIILTQMKPTLKNGKFDPKINPQRGGQFGVNNSPFPWGQFAMNREGSVWIENMGVSFEEKRGVSLTGFYNLHLKNHGILDKECQ